ncbi:hypothetical protein [Euzebya sp.]|uniref:hypothetical protein n=1 Tax=Euzebya sp. TaxID=1971409 RepID=UPI003513C582
MARFPRNIPVQFELVGCTIRSANLDGTCRWQVDDTDRLRGPASYMRVGDQQAPPADGPAVALVPNGNLDAAVIIPFALGVVGAHTHV